MSETTEPDPNAEAFEAFALLGLVLEQQQSRGEQPVTGDSWIRRRVERIELLDDRRIRRRISLDLAIPRETAAGVPTEGIRYLPLTWLSRDNKLREFDLRDEDGRSIAVATREEGARLAVLALETHIFGLVAAAADDQHVAPPHDLAAEVRRDLDLLATGSLTERVDALERFETASPAGGAPDCAAFQRSVLMADAALAVLVGRLIEEFILLAAVPGRDAHNRRVLKLTWVEHADEGRSFWRWLKTRMGWSPVSLRFPVAQLDSARSYHIEMGAPSDDGTIEWAALEVAGRFRRIDKEEPAHLVYALGGLPVAPFERPLDPTATFALRAARSGFLRLALFTCMLSFVLLALGRWRLGDLTRDVESAATLLLFVPGLLSLYVVRPGEHGFATQLFSGVRWMVISTAVFVLAGGVLVIVDMDPVLREQLWTSLVVAALLATIAVGWSNYGPLSAAPVVGSPKPHAGPSRSRRGPAHWVVAACAYVAVLATCVAVPLLATGEDGLSVQGRLEAQIADAARGDQRLSLSSFAETPWTRLYAFAPGTVRAEVARTVGPGRLAAGEEREQRVPRRVARKTTLLVLVDRKRVTEVMTLPNSRGDLTDAANPGQCYLVPTDALEVSRERVLTISTPSACRRR